MNDRFIKVVDNLNLGHPATNLSEKLSYSKGKISEYLNNKKNVPKSFLLKFCEAYDLDYQKEFGAESKKESFIKLRQSLKDSHYEVYETDSRAAAGAIELINDEPNMIFDPIKYGELQDVVGTVSVSGNSMYPTIANGCKAAVKRLYDITLIVPGRIYMVVDANYSQYVKRVYEDTDGILLTSDNKAKDEGEPSRRQYPDFKRKWSQIAAIYEVKAIINLL